MSPQFLLFSFYSYLSLTDYIDVAGVISNYSAASIPLETMWTDIGTVLNSNFLRAVALFVFFVDYMDRRRIFTLDPQYFPLNRVREIVDWLHAHNQKYSKSPRHFITAQ